MQDLLVAVNAPPPLLATERAMVDSEDKAINQTNKIFCSCCPLCIHYRPRVEIFLISTLYPACWLGGLHVHSPKNDAQKCPKHRKILKNIGKCKQGAGSNIVH